MAGGARPASPPVESIASNGGSADGDDRLDALERQVRLLGSFESARRLHARYAQACDDADADEIARLFRPGAELWAGSTRYEGQDAIRRFYRAALGVTCHVVGVADLVGDGATVDSRATFVAVESSGPSARVIWGRYVDRIVVDADAACGARYASRRIALDGTAGLAAPLEGVTPS